MEADDHTWEDFLEGLKEVETATSQTYKREQREWIYQRLLGNRIKGGRWKRLASMLAETELRGSDRNPGNILAKVLALHKTTPWARETQEQFEAREDCERCGNRGFLRLKHADRAGRWHYLACECPCGWLLATYHGKLPRLSEVLPDWMEHVTVYGRILRFDDNRAREEGYQLYKGGVPFHRIKGAMKFSYSPEKVFQFRHEEERAVLPAQSKPEEAPLVKTAADLFGDDEEGMPF